MGVVYVAEETELGLLVAGDAQGYRACTGRAAA
jgi:hypothetical protein